MVRRQMEDRSLIAETLRKARERLELTIERAAADAGVPLRYARLLEGERLPGVGVSDELYLIPFFRRYAAGLGLPAEDLLADFLGQVQELPPPNTAALRLRVAPRRNRVWSGIAVLVAVAGAAFVILQHTPERQPMDDDHWSDGDHFVNAGADAVAAVPSADDSPAALASPQVVAAAPIEDRAAPPGVETPVVPVQPAAAASPAAGTSPEAGARELRIVAAQETWLSLGIDDEPKRNILLQPGETRRWTATRAFTLTVGNAGGITVSFDGRELPPLGRPGQVVRNLRLPQGESPPTSG